MSEIQLKQLRGAPITPDVLTALGASERQPSRSYGSYLAGSIVACVLSSGLLAGCGNKGDLYLESDVVAAEALEDAAEKLKKRKKSTSE